MEFEKRCWAEISLDNLRFNFNLIQQKAGDAKVMAVVKADGYGHGDLAVARLFADCGAAYVAVSGFEEALRLKNNGINTPVLILGYTDPGRAKQLAENNIIQTVFSLDYAKELSQNAIKNSTRVKVHFKLDTGMSRLGFGACDDVNAAVLQIKEAISLQGILPEGLYTHFSVADSTLETDIEYTKAQHALLQQAHEALPELELVHCSNSAAILYHQAYAHNIVRPGIILYGENPSNEVGLSGLKPALVLKTVVSHVKIIQKGQCVSYGRKFTADKDMCIATLAVGYADGYPRALSNKGTVSLHGIACKVLGSVCMDQMMIDVSDVANVKIGDVAVVFGQTPADSAAEVARLSGTIVYEILCGLSRRVPRVYTDNNKTVAVVDYLI